jgi:tRNA dimethylallyltransferase
MSSMIDAPPAIFLMGPTASGKTDLAVALTEQLPCDIISVDSAMIYRGMDIGTAKPDVATLARAPHRLIDILDPTESYSAAQFRVDALREMAEITARGRVPLLVGGTMLYFRALQQGLSDLPSAQPEVRARLDAEARAHGWQHMHQRLAAVDPAAAQRIHPNDPQRIQRALEVYELTGRSMTELCLSDQGAAMPLPYRLLKIVVAPRERAVLHARIDARFRTMLDNGLLAEVEGLYSRGDLHPGLPAMRAVGYRQIWACLEGQVSFAEMVENAIKASRQLAKRQLTWLRGQPDAVWFDSLECDLLDRLWQSVRCHLSQQATKN